MTGRGFANISWQENEGRADLKDKEKIVLVPDNCFVQNLYTVKSKEELKEEKSYHYADPIRIGPELGNFRRIGIFRMMGDGLCKSYA